MGFRSIIHESKTRQHNSSKPFQESRDRQEWGRRGRDMKKRGLASSKSSSEKEKTSGPLDEPTTKYVTLNARRESDVRK